MHFNLIQILFIECLCNFRQHDNTGSICGTHLNDYDKFVYYE